MAVENRFTGYSLIPSARQLFYSLLPLFPHPSGRLFFAQPSLDTLVFFAFYVAVTLVPPPRWRHVVPTPPLDKTKTLLGEGNCFG